MIEHKVSISRWTWKRRQSKHLDEGTINWNAWAGGRLVENHALILSTGGWAPQLADSYFNAYAKTKVACYEAVIVLELKFICCHSRYSFQITIWPINWFQQWYPHFSPQWKKNVKAWARKNVVGGFPSQGARIEYCKCAKLIENRFSRRLSCRLHHQACHAPHPILGLA